MVYCFIIAKETAGVPVRTGGKVHMEYSRVEIRPGVWLTHLREEKFKTACFSVNLLSQLSRQTVSMNALVP